MSEKKSKRQFPIIVLIILLIIVVVVFIFIKNIFNIKSSITSSKFEEIMKENNYNLGDATEQYNNNDGLKKVTVAVSPSTLYQIDFFELETDDFAKSIYQTNRDRYEKRLTNNNISSEDNGNNWSIYILEKDTYFFYVARIDKTVLIIDSENIYKNEFIDILKKLGYNK